MNKIYLFGTKEIKELFFRVIEKRTWKGQRVLDFPAGSGVTSRFLSDHGAEVVSADAFPDFFKVAGLKCVLGDLQSTFAFSSEYFDCAIFQEGIEHLPNPLFALKEFSRVLKKNGILYVTTPNYSNLRSRFAYLLFEAETPKMLPPNEIESIWRSSDGTVYYGHIFSIGIMRLRMLSILAGFKLVKVHPARINITSLLLFVIFWPFLIISSFASYRRSVRKHKPSRDSKGSFLMREIKDTFKDLVRLNFHPSILLGGHLILEFHKKDGGSFISVRNQEIIDT